MDRPAPSMMKAAAIGGAAAGVASAIPGLSYVNCACCALVIGGGLLAAFLYSKDSKAAGVPFTTGRGATVGLVAGLFYAVAGALVTALIVGVFGNPMAAQLDQMEQMGGDIPPEMMEFFETMAAAGPGLIAAVSLGINLIVGLIFSTIGGLIGGMSFKFEPAPPAPPASGTGDVVPPPAPPTAGA